MPHSPITLIALRVDSWQLNPSPGQVAVVWDRACQVVGMGVGRDPTRAELNAYMLQWGSRLFSKTYSAAHAIAYKPQPYQTFTQEAYNTLRLIYQLTQAL